MTILNMGYPIASKYNIILVSLSRDLNITFFLLVVSLSITTNKYKLIVVRFVNNGHWVQVKLKPDCPLPPVTDRWRQNCNEDTRVWKIAYTGRIRHREEVRKSI